MSPSTTDPFSDSTSGPNDRNRVPEFALALVGGLAWSACFSAESLPLLAWIALIPLVLCIDSERPLFNGWLFGLAAWLPSTHWVATTLEEYGPLHPALATLLWVALCAALALECLVFVALGRALKPLGAVHLLWILPAVWVLLEAQRGFMVHGFPWNLAAYAWVDLPGAMTSAAWLGAWGLSFLVVTVNVAAVLAWQRRSPRLLLGVWTVVALGLMSANALVPVADVPVADVPSREPMPVRVVQPNSGISFEPEELLANYELLIRLTHEACDTPALVVWPESAAWPFNWDDAPRLRRDVEMINRLGCAVLLNSPRQRGDRTFNTALLIAGDGQPAPAEYAKRRLVPWGEYIPLADWFPFIGRLARNAGQFTPGTELGLMPFGGHSLAMAICYEVIFASLVSEQSRAGADVLLTVTNDAWYGNTAAPWQHLRAARFRAAENQKPMIRAALTGVSAIIDSRGRVVEQLGVEETGILRGEVVGSPAPSPYSRAPWWPVWTSAVLLGFAMIRVFRFRRANETPRPPGTLQETASTASK